MPKHIKLNKGLNIKLLGEAERLLLASQYISTYAIKPDDFIGMMPKLLVKEDDMVSAGSPVFYNKSDERIQITSPVSGKITAIVRGEKRIIEEIHIEATPEQQYIDFGKAIPADLSKGQIIEKLLESGVWAYIRQRPYSIIANPSDLPKAIFVSAFDTSPLAPDYDYILHGKGDLFQTGLDVLAKLTEGKIHLNLHTELNITKVFSNAKNVEITYFSGPHPSGNVGIQIHHINPINKGDIIWYVNSEDVVTIGTLFTEGKYDASKIIALCGSEVLHPKYHKAISGCCISNIAKNNVSGENLRYISGNPLTGKKITADGYLGFYDHQLTIIPEGDHFEFFGWAKPGLQKFSFSRSYFSWLSPWKKYKLDTNIHGGERAYVMTGEYEKVLPMDILPLQLIKAILAEDIDMMEKLGIYEVDAEDFALVEFIDPSKTEIQQVIHNGLALIRKEMS